MRLSLCCPSWRGVFNTTATARISSYKTGANKVFSNQFGIPELLETWITPYKLYEAILFLQLLPLFRRTLQRRFAAKLQKCFVVYETSLVLSSAWVDNDRMFIFVQTAPLNTWMELEWNVSVL